MVKHFVKTDPESFQQLWNGDRTFEIRYDDRRYKVGDEMVAAETVFSGEEMKNGAPLGYTGRAAVSNITDKLSCGYGLKDGWCALSVESVVTFNNFDIFNYFSQDPHCKKCNGTGYTGEEYYHDAGDHFGARRAPGSGYRKEQCDCQKDKAAR